MELVGQTVNTCTKALLQETNSVEAANKVLRRWRKNIHPNASTDSTNHREPGKQTASVVGFTMNTPSYGEKMVSLPGKSVRDLPNEPISAKFSSITSRYRLL